MANARYPRDLSHPNGFRTVTVYSPEEEREVNGVFAAARAENAAAHAASLDGKKIAPSRNREGA